MFARRTRLLALLLTFAMLAAETAAAAEVRMIDGTVYYGVTVTRRDAVDFECFTQRGRILLPVYQVVQIDGVRLDSIPEGRYPYVASLSAATPAISLSPPPRSPSLPFATPATAPSRRSALATTAPAPRPVLRTPIPSIAPSPRAVATPAPPPPPETPALTGKPWYENVPWRLLAVAAACVIWGLSVFRVWRDARRTPSPRARAWLVVAVVLPIVGYLVYELTRMAQNWRRSRRVVAQHRREFIFLDADHHPILIAPGQEASGLENAKDVLQDALLDRASDVHIEPGAAECRVRFRIDGVLHPRMKFPAEEGLRLVSALKTVAQLDIAERRKAQDGRFGGRVGDRLVDFRAATTPSVYGEKLVLRVLDQTSGLRGLTDLGMNEKMMARFAEVIQSRSGMIIATGPTGSGKTSSLYAALTQLDNVRLNVVTIEDPVEYELRGATQIPVNAKAGVTFESGLNSILRQDPDVILVGEMRDLEAAQIALRSALTGHLVFTSLHTKDAVGTIHRLEEMGLERHLIASALFVVMSQRLVRILCTACREEYPCTGSELAEIGIELPAGEKIYRAVGCRRCEGSGYVGRTGIFEMLILDEQLRQEINTGTPEDPFTGLARTKGFRGYREDGAEKVLLGVTSADEVLKAI